MQYLVCYDVVEDARRNRLFKALRGILRPVQKSVFEGPLPSERRGELLRRIERNIDPEQDTVRVYGLCRGCRRGTLLFGTAVGVPSEVEDVIV